MAFEPPNCCTHSKILQNVAKYRSILILFRIVKSLLEYSDHVMEQAASKPQIWYEMRCKYE